MAYRSLIYLTSFGAIGYVLLKATEPSQDKLKEINRASSQFMTDEQRKKALIVEKLKEAAYGEPVWRQNPQNQSKEKQQQPTKREIN
jgi:hypothetical protein